MTADPSSADYLAADESWDEIDRLVDDLARLSKSANTPREFYAELIERSASSMAAVGGAAWLAGSEGRLDLAAQVHLAKAQAASAESAQQHRTLLAETLAAGESRLLAPEDKKPNGLVNGILVVLCPVMLEGQAVGVLEIFQRADVSPAVRQGNLRLLTVLAELAAELHRHLQWREFRDRAATAGEFDKFIEQVHHGLDVKATAYAIANEGRRVAGVDRLSVLVTERGGCRLVAMSGLDTFDRRAEAVRTLEQLAAAVVAWREPLWFPDDGQEPPPQIEERVQSYVDTSHVRSLAVLPLASSAGSDRVVGALVVERFEAEQFDEVLRRRMEALARHSASALSNAVAHERVPLVRILERLDRAAWFEQARQSPRWMWIAAAVLIALAGLAIVPADFELEARGQLQPRERRDVFAPTDGIVRDVNVEHGTEVKAGQVLIALRKPELDVEFNHVLGEMLTARKRLESIQAARLVGTTNDAERQARDNQLTADEEETKEKLKSLEAEHKILRAQQAELEVRAPIDGVVVTWDVERLLTARPVTRGQPLVTVARTAGPWVLEAKLKDDEIGPLLAAQRELGPERDVTFIVATDPAATYQGRVTRVAMATEPDEKTGPTVLVTVDIDRNQLSDERRRPGATVIAQIDCGREPLGYVWFHELLHAIRSRLLF